ncbi:MAG: O-antigen ligase family protein [Phascolarctobacterium sp.]|nr:O-antigen ligase family protein [Phascolarctobacterium sp.]
MQLASLLCILVPAVVIILLDDEFSSRMKLVAKIVLPFLFIGMLAGRSRGLWLALLIVLPLVMWKYLIKNRKALMITALIVAILCGFFATQPAFVKRVKSITNITTDISNRDRIVIWRSAKNMIKDHPITGVGLGQFKKNYFEKYQLREIKQRHLNHTHNNVLQICTETGIPGALGFIYLSLYILIKNFREWLRRKDPYSLIIWGSWLAFIIFGVFDVIIDHSAVTKSWWFLLGTMLVMKNGRCDENISEQ